MIHLTRISKTSEERAASTFLWMLAVPLFISSATTLQAQTDSSSRSQEGEAKMLHDFKDPKAADSFRPINDTVMGGVSSSEFVASASGTGLFRGKVSLENNGGFASVRSRADLRDLSAFTGVRVKLRGDGKRYRLNLRTDANFDGVTYRSDFETEANTIQTLDFPFSKMLPSYHGETLENRAPIDPAKVQTIGFLISDGQEGKFRLEIETIEAYRKADSD